MIEDENTRRRFTRELKIDAVESFLVGNRTGVEIARDLGIRVELLYRWKNEYLTKQEQSFSGSVHSADPGVERIQRLERELARVREERDVLKRALVLASKKPK